jgi:hypothetical protein
MTYMTKQHFIAFAAEAKRHRQTAAMHTAEDERPLAVFANGQAQGIEDAVVKLGKQFNPNFDEDRFRRACHP